LKIYTTIDKRIQQHAETAMVKHMRQLQVKFFDHWNVIKPDPWTYDGDNSDIDLKLNALQAQIYLTDRYRSMREQIMGPALASIEEEHDLTLSDFMIRQLVEEHSNPGVLDVLQTQGVITRKQKETYRQLVKSDNWATFKQDWLSFQRQVDEVFNTKVKMRVFTYENPTFEKDTVMSPIDSIKYHRKHLQTGILAIDPKTGHIKAWVGGIDMKYFQQDHIHTSRQVGSTFKPVIYSTAIAFQGISPCSKVFDVQYTINKGEGNFHLVEDWSPKNADGEYLMEPITLYEGLRESKNTLSVFLMKQIGDVEPVRNLAENLGIEKRKLPPVPSLCLGSADISLFEMTGAYAAFANNGVYNQPIFIKHIEDKNGKLIYRSLPEERRVLQEDANYVIVDMLRYAAAYRGGAHELKTDFGGKTGTTQNHSDGWFIGITPNLVVGTWVGGEDRWIRFRDLAIGQGSVMARPIVIDLIKQVEADPDIDFNSESRFYKPENLSITINCEEYNRLNPGENQELPHQGRKDDFF
jgi:penicillin-binding protein 1A